MAWIIKINFIHNMIRPILLIIGESIDYYNQLNGKYNRFGKEGLLF